MSSEKVIYAMLTGTPEVTAIVGDDIYPVIYPLNKSLPGIMFRQESRQERLTVSQGELVHVTCVVSVVALAKDHTQMAALVAAIRKAMANRLGNFAGVLHVTSRPGPQQEDNYDSDLSMYSRSSSFVMTFSEPV